MASAKLSPSIKLGSSRPSETMSRYCHASRQNAPWIFVQPAVEMSLRSQDGVDDDGERVAEYRLQNFDASLAVGVLRGHVVEHHCEPSETLQEMNSQLLAHRIDNRFVAMGFALYDPDDRSLLLANSGLPRPLLVREGRVRELAVEGVPLGMFDSSI